jgi:hypothetical protein
LPLWCPIMGSHIQRLGVTRVVIGAIGMYLSIPVFMIVHAIVIQLFLRWAIYPFLGLGHLTTEKFLILDRYKVRGLSAIDKFHCLFCGWVSGICTFLDHIVDLISNTPRTITPFKRIILALVCMTYTLPALMIQTCFFFIYNYLIAAPLRLEKVYYGPLIKQYCFVEPYARKHRVWTRRFLTYQKISWRALGLALKQIESAWCPIKHFEKMGNVTFPDHHKLFFEPDKVDELRRFLCQHGTALERKLN